MYTVFGADQTLRAFLIGYAATVILAAYFLELPTSVLTAFRWAVLSVGLFMAGAALIAGWSAFFSPWRIAFRLWRRLNEWVYPDLNGVWYGNTQSNWGVIETKREAAEADGGLTLGDLPSVPLKEGEIALDVRADLFRIRVRAKVSDTGGASVSLSSRAEKANGEYRLSYLYRQETPEPLATDEGVHDGAATLRILFGHALSMEGVYWTRRKWREGMNTAGVISVRRVTPMHAPRDVDLLEYARQRSRVS